MLLNLDINTETEFDFDNGIKQYIQIDRQIDRQMDRFYKSFYLLFFGQTDWWFLSAFKLIHLILIAMNFIS